MEENKSTSRQLFTRSSVARIRLRLKLGERFELCEWKASFFHSSDLNLHKEPQNMAKTVVVPII